jgi:type IV pilus assembly protein PilY1
MDLPGTGERVAYNPILDSGDFIVPTLIPSATPCLAGGSSFLMALDALSGSRLGTSPFDTNGDNSWTSADNVTDPSGNLVPASGIQFGQGGIITTPTVIQSQSDPTLDYGYASSSKGGVTTLGLKVQGNKVGRIVWREIHP